MSIPRFFAAFFLSAFLLTCVYARADEPGKLIFADNFDRKENNEGVDGIGNGWGTNSKTRAKGNKQVALRDGAMHIFIHEAADHAVSVRHDAEFTDGVVKLRFKLEHDRDVLGLDFADLQLKTVHAGHLFKVTVYANKTTIVDMKTGTMKKEIHDAKKGAGLTPEMKKLLVGKTKQFKHKLETDAWHSLVVRIAGDTVSVSIDGKDVGSFASEGFAHPTKRMLRLSVPRQAVVDDLQIYSISK